MKEIILTEELVRTIAASLREVDKDYGWGQGEFRNCVFERLVDHFELPWAHEECGDIPDWKDAGVKTLLLELGKFEAHL